MPANYTDQFWVIDPYAPPPAGTTLQVETFELTDQDDDGDVGRAGGDSVDGQDVTNGYPGDTVTVELSDGSETTITGTTLYLADGRIVFTPTDGSSLEDAELVSTTFVSSSGTLDVGQLGPPCLVAGTRVRTPLGEVPVDQLSKGDFVLAPDGRQLELRAVLSTQIDLARMPDQARLRPIRIIAGALGAGLPKRDLLVSRQHRMVLRSTIAKRMFGADEVLVSALRLLDLPGVFSDPTLSKVTYYHLLFDAHEIILAEGAETESLLIGPEAEKTMDAEVLSELRSLFPDAFCASLTPEPARPIPAAHLAKKLIKRHADQARDITTRP